MHELMPIRLRLIIRFHCERYSCMTHLGRILVRVVLAILPLRLVREADPRECLRHYRRAPPPGKVDFRTILWQPGRYTGPDELLRPQHQRHGRKGIRSRRRRRRKSRIGLRHRGLRVGQAGRWPLARRHPRRSPDCPCVRDETAANFEILGACLHT